MKVRVPFLLGMIASLAMMMESARATIVLYDASTNQLPTAQGWVYLTDPLFPPIDAKQSVSGGVLTLDTTADISELAGYFSNTGFTQHPQNPVMDLSASAYSIEFTMRQVSGTDVPDSDPLALNQRNRGGFALIALTSDLRGIELQFQTDHVVALDNGNTAFGIGEVHSWDTTDALHNYQLRLSNGGYQLSVDDNLLLQGALRDYSSIGPVFPYSTANFLFFGDDTGRGAAATQLTHLQVTAIPEPSPILLFVGAAAVCGLCRYRRPRRATSPNGRAGRRLTATVEPRQSRDPRGKGRHRR